MAVGKYNQYNEQFHRHKRSSTNILMEKESLDDGNPKSIPSGEGTLSKDKSDDICNDNFNYASGVGMLLYL